MECWLIGNMFFSRIFFPHKNFSHLNDLHLPVLTPYKENSINHSSQEYGQEELYFIVIVS